MSILGWILFGLVVGVVAKFLMPGRDPGGFVITVILGIVGAVVGGFVGRTLGWYGPGDPVGFVMALVGAVILLVAYRALAGQTVPRVELQVPKGSRPEYPSVHQNSPRTWVRAPRAETECWIGTTSESCHVARISGAWSRTTKSPRGAIDGAGADNARSASMLTFPAPRGRTFGWLLRGAGVLLVGGCALGPEGWRRLRSTSPASACRTARCWSNASSPCSAFRIPTPSTWRSKASPTIWR